MRGVYTAHIEIAALAAAKSLLLGEMPADGMIEILEARVLNSNVIVYEHFRVGLFRVNVKGSPVGGGTVLVQKSEKKDAATFVTWLGDLTTEPTSYESEPLDLQGLPNTVGYNYDPVPETRIIVPPSKLIGLRILDVPVATFRAEVFIKYREIG